MMSLARDRNDFIDLLELHKELLKKGRHNVKLGGYEFVVLPDVFPPDYCQELGNCREEVLDNIPRPTKQEFEFMEMGSGTGVFCAAYYLRYQEDMKRAIGVDVNPEAVKNTELNFKKYGINGEVIVSDLFEKLDPRNDKVDMIYANLPWMLLKEDYKNIDMLMKSIADPGYQVYRRFLQDFHKFLKPNGRVFMHLSPDIADLDAIKLIAKQCGKQLISIYEGSVKRLICAEGKEKANEDDRYWDSRLEIFELVCA